MEVKERMVEFQNSLRINTDVSAVYEYLSKVENFSKWNYAVSEVKKLKKKNGAGKELYGIYRKSSGPKYEEGYLESSIPNQKLVMVIKGGWFPYEMEYTLSVDGSQTLLNNKARLSPSKISYFPLQLAKNNLQKAVYQNLLVLKSKLENY